MVEQGIFVCLKKKSTMPKAFISHSSKDKPFVRKLKEDLNFNDVETWVDEDELKPGDKLYDTIMLSLQNSSHFLIVLSNNIKNSHWVNAEINEAIKSLDKKIIKKIIPVLLRKTEIPEVFKGLLYADFSNITFTLTEDKKVNSTGNKYNEEVDRILKAINQTEEFSLSKSEINQIVKKAETTATTTIKPPEKIVGLYEIVGFATTGSRNSYVDNLKRKYPKSLLAKLNSNKIIPIILPSLLMPLFDKIKLGEEIYFLTENDEHVIAHFCGFSSNNSRIVLPVEIRREFNIKTKDIISVGIDGINREIILFEE